MCIDAAPWRFGGVDASKHLSRGSAASGSILHMDCIKCVEMTTLYMSFITQLRAPSGSGSDPESVSADFRDTLMRIYLGLFLTFIHLMHKDIKKKPFL